MIRDAPNLEKVVFALLALCALIGAVTFISSGELKSDRTIHVDNAIRPSDYALQSETVVASDYLGQVNAEEALGGSDAVVLGKVVSQEHTYSGINAWTKEDIVVEEDFTGGDDLGVSKGDVVSVFIQGGYIPLRERVVAEEAAGATGLSAEFDEIDLNETVEKQTVDGQDPLAVGETAVFCIVETENPEWTGAYEASFNMQGVFRLGEDGEKFTGYDLDGEPFKIGLAEIRGLVGKAGD